MQGIKINESVPILFILGATLLVYYYFIHRPEWLFFSSHIWVCKWVNSPCIWVLYGWVNIYSVNGFHNSNGQLMLSVIQVCLDHVRDVKWLEDFSDWLCFLLNDIIKNKKKTQMCFSLNIMVGGAALYIII